MKKWFFRSLILVSILMAAVLVIQGKTTQGINEKIYVAIEGEGKIAVIDSAKQSVIKNIDLSKDHKGGKLTYAPHNIQVAPDGSTVWVTANASGHTNHTFKIIPEAYAHIGDEEDGNNVHTEDEIVVIDSKTDKIIQRIPVEVSIHLAHVVLTPGSNYAYATAQKEGRIYKINVKEFRIERTIKTPDSSEPHGLRISPDGSLAFIAFLNGKSLGILDLKTDESFQVALEGQAVQSALTPDGRFAFVALYDSKKIAVYDLTQKSISYIQLPETAKGPIQLYPTPDSQFIYVADQGYYFNQPQGKFVYKIDINQEKVVNEIKTGDGPHGVVVSKDGKFVYVTNLISGDLSVINTSTNQEVAKIPVGKEPNSISIWSRDNGGTP